MRLNPIMNLTVNNLSKFKTVFNNNRSLIVYVNHALLGFHLSQSRRYECYRLKVGLSPSKKNYVICFIESPLKMIKNAFCFILKPPFVLKIFKFSSQLFGHAEKMT